MSKFSSFSYRIQSFQSSNQRSKRILYLPHLELNSSTLFTLLLFDEQQVGRLATIHANLLTFPIGGHHFLAHQTSLLLAGARIRIGIREIVNAFGCGTAVSRAQVKLVAVRRVAATINRVLESKSRRIRLNRRRAEICERETGRGRRKRKERKRREGSRVVDGSRPALILPWNVWLARIFIHRVSPRVGVPFLACHRNGVGDVCVNGWNTVFGST